MEQSDSDRLSDQDIATNPKPHKQVLGKFLGIEMTAPGGMKKPLLVLLGLIAVNISLLFLLSKVF